MMVVKIPCSECRIKARMAYKSLVELVDKMMAGKRLGGYELYDPSIKSDLSMLEDVLSRARQLVDEAKNRGDTH